jgi:hypothetical protein
VDLSFVLNSFSIMLSTYHEVFRYHGMANSVRVVSETICWIINIWSRKAT